MQDARIVRADDLPEGRADVLRVVVEILELRMVEDVECIHAKLKCEALSIERSHFRKRQIQVGASWSTNDVARGGAIALDDIVVKVRLTEELQAVCLWVQVLDPSSQVGIDQALIACTCGPRRIVECV